MGQQRAAGVCRRRCLPREQQAGAGGPKHWFFKTAVYQFFDIHSSLVFINITAAVHCICALQEPIQACYQRSYETTQTCTGTYNYRSGKVYSNVAGNGADTQGVYKFMYGRMEVRVSVPCYPSDGSYGIWPRSGELDVMEHINREAASHETIHYAAGSNGAHAMQSTWIPHTDLGEGAFHTFAVERSRDHRLAFYVDGQVYLNPVPWDNDLYGTPNTLIKPFDQVRVWNEPETGRRADTATAAASTLSKAHSSNAKPQATVRDLFVNMCSGSRPYMTTARGKQAAPWTVPSAGTTEISAPFYDQGSCSYERPLNFNYLGNAPALRGESGLDVTVIPDSNTKFEAYLAPFGSGSGSRADYTVAFGAADANFSIEVVVSDAQPGSTVSILLDSTKCHSNVAEVHAQGGELLIAATSLQQGSELRHYGSNLTVPGGVHTVAVCGGGGSFALHTLRIGRTDAAASAAGSAADNRGLEPVPVCFSHSCYKPPVKPPGKRRHAAKA
ncbi:hypothetical protein JKP88DRAFT_254388 [Tribonema minus]|uniref:GH16 domain-containing protein n=1 Tax=Tribonema minus TaxID=303371 RepID=A0A836CIP8_9STRA|nr:hypothetical protein JKP88DRAFT_254388 [Tribonema minus]